MSAVRDATAENTKCSSDTALECLVLIARYFRLAVEPDQIRHELGLADNVVSGEDLLRAAKRIGFRARQIKSTTARLNRITTPVIVEMFNGDFAILARVSDKKVLIHDAGQSKARELDTSEFEAIWSGRLYLMTTRAQLAGALRNFDFTWFIPVIVRYRRLFAEVLVASFFLQLFGLLTPIFFQVIIDKVLVNRGLTTLDVLVVGLVTVSIFEVLIGILRTFVFSHTTSRVDVELGAKLYRHLLSLPIAYFEARQTGHSVARVRELETIRSFLTGSALTLVIDLFFTVVFFAVMWVYSPALTLIVMGSVPLYVALAVIITPILRSRLDEKFNRGAENQAFLVESVSGVETLKAVAVEPQMQRRWEEQLSGYVQASFRANNLSNIAGQLAQLIQKVVMAATLWFGARLVMDEALTVGQFVAFNMLANRVSAPILRLSQLWEEFQQVRISLARLGDILNSPTEIVAGSSRSALPAVKGQITFDHVTFRYRPSGPEILKDICLAVPEGQMLGIVGPSGSGKSTLAKLIQRLYVPESGRVLVDGVDLALVDPSWLRRQIGVVLQDDVLFSKTVRENIALADPGMPIEQVMAAARMAGAHDFILELPYGYDTEIVERGANLSGGQRQRIAIARALVTNPRILIFDEATSALDYESEQAIQANMRQIAKERTVIIVAHRLAALQYADRIITVEDGRIVEDGSHASLIKSGGRYASLFAHQVGWANKMTGE